MRRCCAAGARSIDAVPEQPAGFDPFAIPIELLQPVENFRIDGDRLWERKGFGETTVDRVRQPVHLFRAAGAPRQRHA